MHTSGVMSSDSKRLSLGLHVYLDTSPRQDATNIIDVVKEQNEAAQRLEQSVTDYRHVVGNLVEKTVG